MIVELRLLVGGTFMFLSLIGFAVTIKDKRCWNGWFVSYAIGLTLSFIWIIWTIVRYFAGGQAGAIDVAHGFASAGGGY